MNNIRQIIVPLCDLKKDANFSAELETQCLYGEVIEIIDKKNNWLYCKTQLDNYNGWIHVNNVGKLENITHKVTSLITHLYSEPDIKSNILNHLYFNSKISTKKFSPNWYKTEINKKIGYINKNHIQNYKFLDKNWTSKALTFLGVPYLWGGKSYLGIDCSGLVQVILENAGMNIPRNTQDQIEFENKNFFNINKIENNSLIFWKGHVAIAINKNELIHSNAYHMSVKMESIEQAINRIKNLYGKVVGIKKIII